MRNINSLSGRIVIVVSALIFTWAFTGCGRWFTARRTVEHPPAPIQAPQPATQPQPQAPVSEPKPAPYQVMGKWYQPIQNAQGFEETGLASWYGKKFHGRKTSSGEIYDMHGISAAHKTLPMETYVRVYNLENQRNLDVRINDRGPFVAGRIIDLSYGAAKELGVVEAGTAKVKIVALGQPAASASKSGQYTPVDFYSGNFTYQIGAFKVLGNAERLKAKLSVKYKNAHITTYDSPDGLFYRVRVGKITNLNQAREQEKFLIADGYKPFIVAE